MKRQIAFLVSAMMTVNLFTAVPAFATDDFSDAEVVVEEDSNEDAEEMEIQDSTEEDFEDEGAVTEDSAASESEVDSVTDVDLFSDADSEDAVALTFSADYYVKKTNGMLITMPIPHYPEPDPGRCLHLLER